MSFHTFNASLPYFASLHDATALEAEVAALSKPLSLEDLKIASPTSEGAPEKNENKFMNALQRIGNLKKTANNANALKTTEDTCLDLYYQLGVARNADLVHSLLEKAWTQDPDMTLHIIWHTRSIHRGKSANDKFYTAFGWLLLHHPQTAIRNLQQLTANVVSVNKEKKNNKKEDQDWELMSVNDEDNKNKTHLKSHGYWKDLVNICQIYVCNELNGPTNTGDLEGKFKALNCPPQKRRPWNGYEDHRHLSRQFYKNLKTLPEEEQAKKRAERNAATEKKQKEQKERQQIDKEQKRAKRHVRVTRLLKSDPCYRALHFTVARLFATQLKADLEQLEKNRKTDSKNKYAMSEGISLAAKWAPTLHHSHDKHTLMATSIAELLYPPTTYQDKDEPREHYINKVRELYRKTYISPLRQALDVTECKMSSGQWTKIDFSHVPSKCMQANSTRFFTHAKEEFLSYLKDVALGKKSVSGATLQPHELIIRAQRANGGYVGGNDKLAKKMSPEALKEVYAMDTELVNAQWKTLIDSIKQDAGPGNETLGSSIAVCDLSGSMMGDYGGDPVPIWPAVGLSLVLAEMAAPPFNGSVITFTDNPTVVNLEVGGKLSENVSKIFSAPVGYSTNFLSVFLDLLLPIAKENKLKQEEMVKRLFVFSDMEFNEGFGISKWETIYEQIKREYEEAGYKMPELVWWNLAQTRPVYDCPTSEEGAPMPVDKDASGCTMISGFSAALMKSFFEGTVEGKDDTVVVNENSEEKEEEESEKTPLNEMVRTIYHKSFEGLAVY
ncbi:hypothetical protein BDC45DRAFT_499363, partial [Circinella umbellata]